MMLKKTLFVTLSLSVLVLNACSFDQRYRREASGNADYLKTQKIKQLSVPQGLRLPAADNTYLLSTLDTAGEVGLNVDILPPSLPLATLDGAQVSYSQGVVTLEMPSITKRWDEIIALLNNKNIVSNSKKPSEIITNEIITRVSIHDVPYKASYRLQHKKTGDRECIVVTLLSLYAGKKDVITNHIEKQRYTVAFFNMIMLELKKNELQLNEIKKSNK